MIVVTGLILFKYVQPTMVAVSSCHVQKAVFQSSPQNPLALKFFLLPLLQYFPFLAGIDINGPLKAEDSTSFSF